MSAKTKQRVVHVSLDSSQFNSLVEAIENLVKVYAAAQIKPEEGTERNARFLRVFGLTQQEIADLVGVTREAVTLALQKRKRRRKKGQKGSDDAVTKA